MLVYASNVGNATLLPSLCQTLILIKRRDNKETHGGHGSLAHDWDSNESVSNKQYFINSVNLSRIFIHE